jgi:hypothetical protein
MWISLAAAAEDKNAMARLTALEKELDPESLARARQRSLECKTKDFKGCL